MSPAAISARMRLEETGAPCDDARRIDAHGEAELAAEGFETRLATSACGAVAEAECLALVDLGGVQRVAQDCAGEVARGPCGGARR